MPSVTRESDACLIINNQVGVYYKCVAQGHKIQGNISYSYRVHEGIILLAADMKLDEKELADIGESGARDEIRRVYGDVIIGPIAITWANAMMGEVTPMIAQTVMSASALKVLLPLNREHIVIAGVVKEPLPHMIKFLVEDELREVLGHV